MRRPVNAQRMAEGAILVITCSAGLAWMAAHILVRAVKAAAKGIWKRAMRCLYPHVMHQRAAVMHQRAADAGLVPALACRVEPWEPAPEPDTPQPWWMHTDTPSPAELTLYDHGEPLRRTK